ncbi:MAG: hypothetical protein ACK55Z_16820 [bacterium]
MQTPHGGREQYCCRIIMFQVGRGEAEMEGWLMGRRGGRWYRRNVHQEAHKLSSSGERC